MQPKKKKEEAKSTRYRANITFEKKIIDTDPLISPTPCHTMTQINCLYIN